MPEEVKFNEEELKQLQEIQNNYISVQNQFGQLKLAQRNLFSNRSLNECAAVRTSHVSLRGMNICSKKVKLQKKEIRRHWGESEQQAREQLRAYRERNETSGCQSQKFCRIFQTSKR